MITIRPAAASDVPWLLEQLRAFTAFYGTRRPLFPKDGEIARALLLQYIESPECFPFFVAEVAGRPCGFIAGAMHPHPWNAELRTLSELFWWVVPQHRGSSAGARLFDAFTAYGRCHADWVIMTLEAHSPVHERTLTKRGYSLHERSFLLEVESLAPESSALGSRSSEVPCTPNDPLSLMR